MKKVVESRSKRKNLKKNSSDRILIIFSLIVLMLIISMIISFLTEGSYKDEKDLGLYQGGLESLGVFKVNNPYPNGSMVSFFVGENRIFNISNNDYQKIEWYFDEKNIKNDSGTIEIKGLSPGNHTLEVRIMNGSQIDSRIWKIAIFEDSEKVIKFVFDAGSVMFWIIFIIILIIIGLVIWLFIKEYKKRKAE